MRRIRTSDRRRYEVVDVGGRRYWCHVAAEAPTTTSFVDAAFVVEFAVGYLVARQTILTRFAVTGRLPVRRRSMAGTQSHFGEPWEDVGNGATPATTYSSAT